MTSHATSHNSNASALFPLLAVLLSTMGALLVVLLILSQSAAKQVAIAIVREPQPVLSQPVGGSADELQQQLDKVEQYQKKLDALRQAGESRVREEQDRLSHLEEHARKLEHELAQLSLAAMQLEATEKNQTVDQKQANAELERLKQLIADTEKQLEDLRKEGTHKHSYAVVPYQGHNGTQRKPIYIECSAEGITLQPEGLRFEQSDFVDPTWPGNPLAAALRATREYLNEKAAQAGEPEPPDPYPLILVRPNGILAYKYARLAITSWDSDFGYEFIDGDWKVDYPDLADPQLARIQQHAVLMARERLQHLVQAAPSQFRGVAIGPGGNGSGSGSAGGVYGAGGDGDGSASGGALANSYDESGGAGNGSAAGNEGGSPGGASEGTGAVDPSQAGGEFQYGGMGGQPSTGAGGSGTYAGGPGGNSSGESSSALRSENTVTGGQSAQTGAAGGASTGGQQGGPGGASATANNGPTSGSPGGGASGTSSQASSGSPGATASASGGASSGQSTASANSSQPGNLSVSMGQKPKLASIAESRGSDWAVEKAMRSAIPVQRPIQVVVRQNQIALLPSRHATQGVEATGTVISLDQPLDRISDEFVAALKDRVDEWGLAGNGLYWRPVLELHVGPDAAETAARLNHLLKDSGVEVRLPETAQGPQGGGTYAPR